MTPSRNLCHASSPVRQLSRRSRYAAGSPVSCCHLLSSGFLFQESRAFTASACVSSDDARMSRRNIWEQSGNKSSSHVLSRRSADVNLLHGFIVNRSDVAFWLTFCVCSIFDNALGFILVIDTMQIKARRHTESWLYAVTSVWDATATAPRFLPSRVLNGSRRHSSIHSVTQIG